QRWISLEAHKCGSELLRELRADRVPRLGTIQDDQPDGSVDLEVDEHFGSPHDESAKRTFVILQFIAERSLYLFTTRPGHAGCLGTIEGGEPRCDPSPVPVRVQSSVNN